MKDVGFKYIMTSGVADLFTKTRRIIVNYDPNGSDQIRFLLPNKYMDKLTITTKQQQMEINKAIKIYTNGKESIEWSMVGIKTAQDIICGYENYCDNNETLFDELKTEEHIEGIKLLKNEIIICLNGQKMDELNSKWQYQVAFELDKYHMFHAFETVIIQTTNLNESKDKNKAKNTHKNKNKNIRKNNRIKNTITHKTSISTNDKTTQKMNLKTALDAWDIECKEILNEFEKRQLQKCNFLDESFCIFIDMEKEKSKLNEMSRNYSANTVNLKKIQKDIEFDENLKQDISQIKNTIRLAKEK